VPAIDKAWVAFADAVVAASIVAQRPSLLVIALEAAPAVPAAKGGQAGSPPPAAERLGRVDSHSPRE
jgi:hypothetical protein